MSDNVVFARQLSLRGIEAVQQGRWDEAESLFSRAIEACPVDERARRRYAEALWRRGAHDAAVVHMEEAARLSAGDPEVLVHLGEMHLARGDLQLAQARVEEAIGANRQLASAWALQGDVYRRLGKPQDALASYHRALSYQDHYPRVQMGLAEIYQDLGRPQRALATLDALADRYAPGRTPPEVMYLQGLALKTLGRHHEAAKALAAASRSGEPTVELLYHLSEAQLLAGDLVNARLAVDKALELAPHHHASQQLKMRVESRQQRMAAAREPGDGA